MGRGAGPLDEVGPLPLPLVFVSALRFVEQRRFPLSALLPDKVVLDLLLFYDEHKTLCLPSRMYSFLIPSKPGLLNTSIHSGFHTLSLTFTPYTHF